MKSPFWRRLAAYCIDYLVIVVWGMVLFGLVMLTGFTLEDPTPGKGQLREINQALALVFVVGIIWNTKNQALYELLSKTRVIRKKQAS